MRVWEPDETDLNVLSHPVSPSFLVETGARVGDIRNSVGGDQFSGE